MEQKEVKAGVTCRALGQSLPEGGAVRAQGRRKAYAWVLEKQKGQCGWNTEEVRWSVMELDRWVGEVIQVLLPGEVPGIIQQSPSRHDGTPSHMHVCL